MKLYNVPNGMWIRVDDQNFHFDHIDGSYSLCYTEYGEICHLAAWTDVEIIGKELK